MKIEIFIQDNFEFNKIYDILTKTLEVDANIQKINLQIPNEIKGRSFGGLLPNYIISQLPDLPAKKKIILLTPYPIQNKDRIVTEENYTLLSTFNLTPNTVLGFNNAIAMLIYGAYLSLSQKITHEGNMRCLFLPSKFDPYIPDGICVPCKNKLEFNGFLPLKKIHNLTSEEKKIGHVVILLHGIRTFAPWYELLAFTLRKEGFNVISARYGFLSLVRFYLNKIFGKKIEEQLYSKYKQARKDNPKSNISIIAHSYGCLVAVNTIKKYQDININNLILSNGVVPEFFDLHELLDKNRVNSILNEISNKDIFPILAKKIIPRAGACGSFCFETDDEKIINRQHPNDGHSSLLVNKNIHKDWVRFLLDPIFRKNLKPTGGNPSLLVDLLHRIPSFIYFLLPIALVYLIGF